jgi:hypothetical protein
MQQALENGKLEWVMWQALGKGKLELVMWQVVGDYKLKYSNHPQVTKLGYLYNDLGLILHLYCCSRHYKCVPERNVQSTRGPSYRSLEAGASLPG